VGLPKTIQSKQGSNCISHLFQQAMRELNTKQIKPNAYPNEPQLTLERFPSTLKNIMKIFCLDSHKDWDNGVRMLLFAVRKTFQESLGFNPFELVFGHSMRLTFVVSQYVLCILGDSQYCLSRMVLPDDMNKVYMVVGPLKYTKAL
jgi:hypothetical protein